MPEAIVRIVRDHEKISYFSGVDEMLTGESGAAIEHEEQTIVRERAVGCPGERRTGRSEYEVVEAVAIDVATGYRRSREILPCLTKDPGLAGGADGFVGVHVESGATHGRVAVDDVDPAAVVGRKGRPSRGADNDVLVAVCVDVAAGQ